MSKHAWQYLVAKIEERYAKHGVNIELLEDSLIAKGDQHIYPVKLKKSTKAADFQRIAPEVQRFLKIPTLIPIIDGLDIMLIVSPSTKPHIIPLASIIGCLEFSEASKKILLPIVLGCSYLNKPVLTNLRSCPHLKISGTSKSGKSSYEKAIVIDHRFKRWLENAPL